ncbi:hypothetical protein EDB87DRAFT_1687209 [Lactarius vividus]|nr:hypothetical protein EDB87DRAFT_1689417 [Lactarius vividus]KAH9056542.1 hypothetical protein EDB87DRAFT_1687209 [Lactarius vividus]
MAIDNDDTDFTPRLPVSSPLLSIYAAVEDTSFARLRAPPAQVPNTSSASHTQLLHERPPPHPSYRDSDFDPPPKWASENLRSLFTHALRDPRDIPRKDARRNSIDSSGVEDSPRIDRVIQERSRSDGKRTSISDEDNTPIPASHAASMEALRSRILGVHAFQSDGEHWPYHPSEYSVRPIWVASMPVASDFSTDNTTLIREMHVRTVLVPGISIEASLYKPCTFLLNSRAGQDSEMERAMGRGLKTQRDRYDSVKWPSKLTNGPPIPTSNAGSVAGTGEFYLETLVYALSYINRNTKRS